MRFANAYVLAALVLIPLFHRVWRRRNEPARVRFALPIPKSVRRFDPTRILLVLRYVAILFVVLALARPQESHRSTQRQVSGVDLMMVLDLSASMNIEDLAEESRMATAKRTMENFIKRRTDDRIGFLVFSGEAMTAVPPTLDYGLLLAALRKADTGQLKDGTAIGDGLATAVGRLKNSKAKSRVIVLLTDGENNVGQVDPLTAGDLAAGYGIKVYTIAIGKEGRVRMPIRRKGMLGETVTTYQWFDNQLNPDLLKQISKATDGKFYRVEDKATLENVFADIDRLEKSEIKTNEKVRYDEIFGKPLLASLLVLGLERLLARLWWRVLP
ncbi:MAG: VWA domain-containing protein [Bdellovibrionales bacterium]|nr:VWA domain-containing protein [Bdellovibrionales bacterium]